MGPVAVHLALKNSCVKSRSVRNLYYGLKLKEKSSYHNIAEKDKTN